jgi:RoxA-like, cytochrome c-like
MKWLFRIAVVLICIALAGVVAFRISVARAPEPLDAAPLAAPVAAEGHNGLSDADRSAFYHLSEGGEIFPLDWVLALETQVATRDGRPEMRPFLANIERYGLIPDAKGPGNPFGLPVGISLAPSAISGIQMIGLNCTACHVGQIEYQGHAMRMDGGPNMALINSFLRDLGVETQATLASPARLSRFWHRVGDVRTARRAADPDAAAGAPVWQRATRMLTQDRGLLQARVDFLRAIPTLQKSLGISTKEGYGRLDAFGIGRDELFGAIAGNSLPADAPVSFPHIWGMRVTGWLQWGANTNSVMERNIGQALGVGALFDPVTFRSTVRLDDLHRLENMAYRLEPPEWPAFLPPIDQAKAARGQQHFTKYCVGCHETWTADGQMREYKLFGLSEVGTDPLTALNYERLVLESDGEVKPFPYAAMDLIKRVKTVAYQQRGIDQKTIDLWEQRYLRAGPRWDPTFRAPLLNADKWDDTKGRKVYRSKTLVGIWATAPFLHNGSVPTLYDLLKPAAERPVTFVLGTREYDPVKLGYQGDASKFVLPPGAELFTFDTRLSGNWNTGHEWKFYPELTDDMRYEIIEFLKTYTKELQPTGAPVAAPVVAKAGR